MKKVIMTVLSLCLIIFYFTYISYYSIDVTNYEIISTKIDQEVKIAMIADVHDYHCRIKDKIIKQIKELHPDVILCVGDIIDNQTTDDTSILNFLKSLSKITDTYMSIGNHEIENDHGDEFIKQVKALKVNVLDKDYVDIIVHKNKIRIGGLYDYAFSTGDGDISKESMHNSSTYQFLNEFKQTDNYQIMMSHRPDSFIYGNAIDWDIDMILSGHVHGGQVILPYFGGLYAPEQGWFPKYHYGKYHLKNTNLIITRGISSSGELLPRWNNPSEIVSITLRGK